MSFILLNERPYRAAELHWNAGLAGQTEKARQEIAALEHEVASFGEAIAQCTPRRAPRKTSEEKRLLA